ncbi:RagB/SusD family nutrient uptake outer membrane protein [Sphingobacterium psychroaquaticum]|uniref:Starch-binding associating with outer membrane n=1 Tax=Sphingobacterium psychroaquaticum TaxID=561061 RepID=A0A1X7LBK9_9SPHI|nr:RagB/SusD family nutrient uptake outer membrane protein [Sphingobacterium psychroaquaticum]SMG51080.1 Starch-binding associating with outer membrane [Sphingobacterium psychroaquaticum]
MIKNIYIKFSLFALVAISQLQVSCNKALDAPSVEVSSEEVHWQSVSDTKAALIGMYGLMRAAMVDNNAHWMFGEFRSGDFSSYRRQDLNAVINSELNKSYDLLENISTWRRFYAVINAASLFIEKAPQVLEHDSRYTRYNLDLDIAQARAIRAFTYFYMVRVWGDVPLITSSFDNGTFPEFPRTDYRDVLTFAEQELIEAVEVLPFRYGVAPQLYYGTFSSNWQKILFNKISGYAILAHLAAWQGKYLDVAAYTQFIMDNYTEANISYLNNVAPSGTGTAGLAGNYGVFTNNFQFGQIINFSAAYSYGEATASGHIEQLTMARPYINRANPDVYVSKDTITQAFVERNDRRFGVDTVSGLFRENYFKDYNNEIPVFNKIKVIRDGVEDGDYAVFGSNLVFTRLEELTLLRAEALAVLGQNIKAIEMLNVIKAMRFTSSYQVSELQTKPLIDEIFKERRRELMGEGWRFFDLVRWNRIKPVNAKVVELIQKDGIYWPISRSVLRNNKLIKQNTYWN